MKISRLEDISEFAGKIVAYRIKYPNSESNFCNSFKNPNYYRIQNSEDFIFGRVELKYLSTSNKMYYNPSLENSYNISILINKEDSKNALNADDTVHTFSNKILYSYYIEMRFPTKDELIAIEKSISDNTVTELSYYPYSNNSYMHSTECSDAVSQQLKKEFRLDLCRAINKGLPQDILEAVLNGADIHSKYKDKTILEHILARKVDLTWSETQNKLVIELIKRGSEVDDQKFIQLWEKGYIEAITYILSKSLDFMEGLEELANDIMKGNDDRISLLVDSIVKVSQSLHDEIHPTNRFGQNIMRIKSFLDSSNEEAISIHREGYNKNDITQKLENSYQAVQDLHKGEEFFKGRDSSTGICRVLDSHNISEAENPSLPVELLVKIGELAILAYDQDYYS